MLSTTASLKKKRMHEKRQQEVQRLIVSMQLPWTKQLYCVTKSSGDPSYKFVMFAKPPTSCRRHSDVSISSQNEQLAIAITKKLDDHYFQCDMRIFRKGRMVQIRQHRDIPQQLDSNVLNLQETAHCLVKQLRSGC